MIDAAGPTCRMQDQPRRHRGNRICATLRIRNLGNPGPITLRKWLSATASALPGSQRAPAMAMHGGQRIGTARQARPLTGWIRVPNTAICVIRIISAATTGAPAHAARPCRGTENATATKDRARHRANQAIIAMTAAAMMCLGRLRRMCATVFGSSTPTCDKPSSPLGRVMVIRHMQTAISAARMTPAMPTTGVTRIPATIGKRNIPVPAMGLHLRLQAESVDATTMTIRGDTPASASAPMPRGRRTGGSPDT